MEPWCFGGIPLSEGDGYHDLGPVLIMCGIDCQSKRLLKRQDWEWESRKRSGWKGNQLRLLTTVCYLPTLLQKELCFFKYYTKYHRSIFVLSASVIHANRKTVEFYFFFNDSRGKVVCELSTSACGKLHHGGCHSGCLLRHLCFVSCDRELLRGTWLFYVVRGPVAAALTFDTPTPAMAFIVSGGARCRRKRG